MCSSKTTERQHLSGELKRTMADQPRWLRKVSLGAVLVYLSGTLCFPNDSSAQVKRPPQAPRPDICVDTRHEDQLKIAEAERVADYYREFAENTQKELMACIARGGSDIPKKIGPSASAPDKPVRNEDVKPTQGPVQIPPTVDTPTVQRPAPPPVQQAAPPPVQQAAPPPVQPADIQRRVREACALMLPATSGAPGAKDIILVSSQRRAPIDQELLLPGAKPMDVEVVDADVCFEGLGADYALVSPKGRQGQVTATIPDGDTPLGRWLSRVAPRGTRVRLAPGSECSNLLDALRERPSAPSAAWVEDDEGLSRCERGPTGDAVVDSTKIDGYSGVIIVRIKRG